MSGLLASFLGAVVREVEAFKAVTSQGDISAVDSGSNSASQHLEPARRSRRKRTKSAPSAPPDKNAVRFKKPVAKKPVMPGSLFPRSPTPSPRERECVITRDSRVRETRAQRRERVESAPEPPILQTATSSQHYPTANLSSPPRGSSPVAVKLERSPSVEIIAPPSTPMYRRGDGRPLPHRTPRNNRTDHRAPHQSSAGVPTTQTLHDTHANQTQYQSQSFNPTSDVTVPATPSTSLRRIRTLEEEIQRLRMQLDETTPQNMEPPFGAPPPPPSPPPPPPKGFLMAPQSAAMDRVLASARSQLKHSTGGPSAGIEPPSKKLRSSLKAVVPVEQMEDFLKEIKSVKLRPRRSSVAGDRSIDGSFSSEHSSFSSQGNKSFEFGMPKLRKVRTLSNGRKVSDIDEHRHSHLGYADFGEESVIVDLTRMEESLDRRNSLTRRAHSGEPSSSCITSDIHHLADGHFFGPSNSQSHSESRNMQYHQSSQDTEVGTDTDIGASVSTLADTGSIWGSMISGSTISTQPNQTPSLASSSSEGPGRGSDLQRAAAVSPATPVDEYNDRTTPRRGESGDAIDAALSPFDDGIPMLDLSRIRIPTSKSRPWPPNDGSPDGRQAKISKAVSRPQGSHKQTSRIPASKINYGARGVESGDGSSSHLAKSVKSSSKSVLLPAQTNGKAAVSREIKLPASRNVAEHSVHRVSMNDLGPNERKVLPRRAKSLEPKVESDEDDDDAALLVQAAELINQARREELSESRAAARSGESSTGNKRKRVCQVDENLSGEGGYKLARLASRAHPSSLEQEMRFAEAQESTAAAIDLVERHQLQYSGIGVGNEAGFMKGGGAGGRPVWSSIGN